MKVIWLPTGVWWKKYWFYSVIAILAITIVCLIIFLPKQKEVTIKTVEVEKLVSKEIPVEVIKEVTKEVVKEVESASLLQEVERLKKELKAATTTSIPAVPPQSELVSWTDGEAKQLMRSLYPGTDKYRDPAFSSTMVYPLSWYQSLVGLPNCEWPAGWITWFSSRYPGIATGYAWVQKGGEWSLILLVPAHVNGVVDLYYFVDKKFVGARGDQTITPFVRAVNLLN